MYFPLKDKRKISIFTMYFTKIFENTFQSISFVESYSIYNRVIFFLGMEPRSTIIKYKLNFESVHEIKRWRSESIDALVEREIQSSLVKTMNLSIVTSANKVSSSFSARRATHMRCISSTYNTSNPLEWRIARRNV